MKKRLLLPLVVCVILLLELWVIFLLPDDTLFNLTGEENLTGQARGLLQLAMGRLRPQPDTQPNAEIQYADVNPFSINTFLQEA